MPHHNLGRYITAALLLAGVLYVGCSREKPPIQLGLVAGLSGGNADLGQAGRNGAMLAVEEANREGGIDGRPIELVIRDDGNKKETAITAARDLVKEKVAAIIGPFTTAMTEAVLTVTDPVKMVVFSPTASSTQFSGKDDYFFRPCATTTDNAEDYAEFMAVRRGYRRISMAIDQQNYTFAQTWTNAFKKKIQTLGSEIVVEIWYDTRTLTGFMDLANDLLQPKPDVILIIANAVDVARIAQQFRKVDTTTKMVAVEWAGTQQLIELGGKAVDGIEVLHLYNKFGKEEKYLRFVTAYQDRFNTPPSFSSILAYETAQILITAMKKTKNMEDSESIKKTILANSPYQGLQQTLKIDAYGDSRRQAHFVIVNGTEFAPAP